MATTESDTALPTDNKMQEIDKITDIEKTESSADNKADVPAPQPQSKKVWLERLILCVALFFPLFLATLDTTIVATALPHIASQFNELSDQSWIANAYILTNTAFLPVYGQVADVFGRHIVMQSAIFIFLVGSALCTGAQTWGMMLAGRAIAGVGAAGCFVMTRIIMSDTNSLRENSTQSTFLMIMFAVAYSIGPVVGGELTSVSWRWCFAINLPVCLIAHVIFFILLRHRVRASTYDTDGESRPLSFKLKKIDYVGLVLFLGACVCIILALIWGGSKYPWNSATVIVLLVLGVVLLAAFIVTEWSFEEKNIPRLPKFIRPVFVHGTPMIPLDIFRDWDVTICQWNNLAGGMVMYGQFYYIAIYFTVVFGYSPASAGQQLLYFLPGLGVGAWSAMFFVMKVFHGTKVTLIVGSVIMAIATGLFSMACENQVKGELFGFMAMMGVGVGMTLMPTQLHSQARMMQYIAIVTAIVSFFRCLGGIVGLTLMSSVVNNKVASAFPSGQSSSSISSLSSIQSLPPAIMQQVQNDFADAIRWAYVALLPFVCIAAISVFFLREVKIERSATEEARHAEKKAKSDAELGQVPTDPSVDANSSADAAVTRTHRPRVKVYGPIMGIVWCCQAIGDKMGWRK